MESTCQNPDLNVKHLLSQLHTARKEINNLRQQLKSLKYIHEKDVDDIKRLLESVRNGTAASQVKVVRTEDVKPSTSTDNDVLQLKPIGVISTWFPNKRATPRQTGICGKVPGKLTLHNSVFTNPEHALEGLQDFSHMWILFHFHRNDSTHIRAKVAPPRLNGTRTGVFSTRSPHRPCPIGLSLVKITGIESHTIYFEGVDMVDQSPVLDIKPYIPQYDSPLYFEKLNNRAQELNINASADLHNSEDIDLHNTATLSREEIFTTFNAEDGGQGIRGAVLLNSYQRDGLGETNQIIDISRDEEIARRLQAEEFQESISFDNYHARSTSRVTDLNLYTSMHIPQDISLDTRSESSTTLGYNAQIPVLDTEAEILENVNNRVQNMSVSDQLNTDITPRTFRDAIPHQRDPQYTSRNSRLLDGADGPNTVCGTDTDLINRRSLNSRIDNSPVRMGIREAPDGEEGLESQVLTPSQTLYNIQTVRAVPNSNTTETVDAGSATSSELRSVESGIVDHGNEVRVPEWISRPRTPLSVVFNDRALIQLNEILGSKINDQKKAIENILREDPRSVYLRQRWGSQFYTFLIHDLHITCRFDDNRGVVTVFQVKHAGRICECGEPEWQCLGHSPES